MFCRLLTMDKVVYYWLTADEMALMLLQQSTSEILCAAVKQ